MGGRTMHRLWTMCPGYLLFRCHHPQRDPKKCRVCGRCAEICPQNAITVKIAADAVERSVERINPLVDVESE